MENEVLGREAELAAVGRLLDGVADAPRAVAVDGAAGIGKTTLWAAGVGLARGRGFRVLQAQPAESEADLSYAALADLVGDVFDGTRSRLPVVQERALGASLLREEADGAAAPRTTATALVGVLAVLAEREPVLLAVDDVQWLDRASEEAVAFAVRRLPPRVGVLVARRSPAAADPPLGLARALPEDRLEHVVLGPLSLAGLHHLIAQPARVAAAAPAARARRGGLGTVTRSSRSSSRGRPPATPARARAASRYAVPPTLEELVGDRLPARCRRRRARRRLRRPPFPARRRPSSALRSRAAASALLEAEEAGVLVSERGRIRFSHPLLASALYALGVARAAAPVARAPRRRGRPDPEERARHLALSATEPDASDGGRARAGGGTGGAARRAARGGRAVRGVRPPDTGGAGRGADAPRARRGVRVVVGGRRRGGAQSLRRGRGRVARSERSAPRRWRCSATSRGSAAAARPARTSSKRSQPRPGTAHLPRGCIRSS